MGDGKENRSRKKPVRIVVKPVYVGSKSMADVFGGVAAETAAFRYLKTSENMGKSLERRQGYRYNSGNWTAGCRSTMSAT